MDKKLHWYMLTVAIVISLIVVAFAYKQTQANELGTVTGITADSNPPSWHLFLEDENPDGKQVGWDPIPEAEWMILKVRHHRNLNLEYEKAFSAWSCCGDWQINTKIIDKADIDLIEDRDYVYRLEAYDDEWNLIARGAKKIKHDVQPSTGITIIPHGSTGVKLYWDGYDGRPSKLNGYRIKWRKKSEDAWNTAINWGHYSNNKSGQADAYKVIGWVAHQEEYVYRIECILDGQRDFQYGTTTYTRN